MSSTSPGDPPHELVRLVLDKIAEIGDAKACEYFNVTENTIRAWKTLKTFPGILAVQRCWDDSLACTTPENWFGKEPVAVLLPIYDRFEPETMVTLVRSMKLYGMDKVTMIPEMRTLVDEARCTLVQKFLAKPREAAVFGDADMVFPCAAPMLTGKYGLHTPMPAQQVNALTRIMSHPPEYGIVGALYRNRRGSFKPACELAYRTKELDQRLRGFFDGSTKEPGGLEETGWVGFGMVRVMRWVFEKMAAAATQNGPLSDIAPPQGRESEPLGYFGRTAAQRGEDVAFCRRAGRIGIKTYVDTGLLLGHMYKGVA